MDEAQKRQLDESIRTWEARPRYAELSPAVIAARDPTFDADAAYLVSAEIVRRRRARGEKPIGRKVGFTNRTIWPEYGVFAPIWACVYDSTVRCLDEPAGGLAIGHLVQPRIEPEIVLHFRSAPRATEDETELLANVDWITHGYEIVQSHFPDWKFRRPIPSRRSDCTVPLWSVPSDRSKDWLTWSASCARSLVESPGSGRVVR